MSTHGDIASWSGRETTRSAEPMERLQADIDTDANRSKQFKIARRHTAIVKTSRLLLPLASLVVAVFYGLAAFNSLEWEDVLAPLPIPAILPENLTMDNPNYQGYGKDGSTYTIRAKTAQQELASPSIVTLIDISGELTDAKKIKTYLKATRGKFKVRENRLQLMDGIDITSDDGMTARLESALIETKEGKITSERPVKIAMRSGKVEAQSMTMNRRSREVRFMGEVIATVLPNAENKAPAEQTDAQPKQAPSAATAFGKSKSPIVVNANVLDVLDGDQRAIFRENVRAAQDDATLVTQEMEVVYIGQAAKAARESSGAPTRVKKIICPKPILISRDDGSQVTGRSAEFFVDEQRATLIGDVVLKSGNDRRASSMRADLNAVNDTALLSGRVVVNQGKNALKGRRLFIDRKNGKMNLTSPAASGGKPGRVFATLVRNAEGTTQPKPKTPKTPAAAKGLASFKTDPSAPIDIEADRLDADNGKREAVFEGRVTAKQGSFVLQTATLTAHYDGDVGISDPLAPKGSAGKTNAKLKRIRAVGGVVVNSGEDQKATGDWAEFDLAANDVVLGGDVTLSQGKNLVSGTRLKIDMDTGETVIDASPSAAGAGWTSKIKDNSKQSAQPPKGVARTRGGRPSAVFFPQQLRDGQKSKVKKDVTIPPKPKKPASRSSSSWDASTAVGQ